MKETVKNIISRRVFHNYLNRIKDYDFLEGDMFFRIVINDMAKKGGYVYNEMKQLDFSMSEYDFFGIIDESNEHFYICTKLIEYSINLEGSWDKTITFYKKDVLT